MKQLIKTIKQISMLLLVISFVGCENDDAVTPKVISGFTHTMNVETGTVTFINTSVNSRNYFWTFGDGTSSTEINPIKTFLRGEYTVTLKATNVAGASDISEDLIVISDVGAPIITILGDTKMNVRVGGTFTDPGATAMDDADGDVSAKIVVAGDVVDVNKAGTYVITYNVSDGAGNTATERTRTVIVANDAVAPVITLKGNASMNVTLGDAFTDPGATATDDVDGDISAKIVVAGNTVNVNKAGTYVITYNVKDAAGNAAPEKTRTVIVAAAGSCATEASEINTAVGLNMTFKTNITSRFKNDNATFAWADNPSATGINTSCKVAKITKGGINGWDNNQIDFTSKFDLSANAGFKMKVYSAHPGYTVLLKLESIADPNTNTEINVTTTKTNEWEELTFAFSSSHTNKYDKVVIIFDLNKAANTNTYYFDDLKLYERTSGGGSTGAYNLTLPIDFESNGFGANWTWNVFENDTNIPLGFVANPSKTGINTSSNVAKITALKSGTRWVGMETASGEMGAPWGVTASNTIIKVMVYKSTKSPIMFKLVGVGGGAQALEVTNTKINEWEEITFDFSDLLNKIGQDGTTDINRIVIHPDTVEGRASDTVFYFDNIRFTSK